MKIFLAFAFRPEDKQLAELVDRLLACQSVQLQTGERLGGEALTPAVKKRIEDCDALIALLTRREQLAAGGWTTHKWVEDELGHARANGKDAIALIEDGVGEGGMYQANEFIPLDRSAPLESLLRLAENVADWKKERGRSIKVRLTPDEVGVRLSVNGNSCHYRFQREGKTTAWQEATPFTEPGGTAYVWVHGVQEDQLVQVHADEPGKHWQSHVTQQNMQVELREGGPGI